ncbi:MAG: ABC transporter substrate binding protein [Gemmatimonadetes bacterium]|nr:ABC transporter substrate binding protein [Gemmatimonadota bacterium]
MNRRTDTGAAYNAAVGVQLIARPVHRVIDDIKGKVMNDIRWCFAFGIFLFFLLLTPEICAQSQKERVAIGVLVDDKQQRADIGIDQLKRELDALLGAKYHIQILEDNILSADWSASVAAKNYDHLMEDGDIDIIIGFGVLTSSVIAQRGTYQKPVIALGIFDPKLQGLPAVEKNRSGVHNLTYILWSDRFLERELDVFYDIFPYQKVGIVFYGEVLNLLASDVAFVEDMMQKNRTSFALLPFANETETLSMAVRQGIDAFYIGYLGPHEGVEKRAFIDAVNNRGMPSFGSSTADVQQGVLAAITPEENFSRIIRRISLHVEAILNGEDAAHLPVYVSFEENLTLNMQTARAIGFSPKFTVLTQAALINEFALEGVRAVDLAQVMREAMNANLELKIEEGTVDAAQQEVLLSRTRFFPSLSVGATGVQIDKNRAEGSFGQQAQRTVTGTAGIEQLIFSEQAMGNVSIQKHLLRASEYGYEKLKLDVILNGAVAYFQILKATTGRRIQSDNVELTRRNLEIAKQREAVGYSGRSDVYRWESRLATANTDLLAAKNNVALAKIQLNQLLNRSIAEPFIARETTLSDSLYISYLSSVGQYIDTPQSLDIYTDFLIGEAIRNAPELGQLSANLNALQRSLRSFQRARFVPTIGLGAEWQYIASRHGAGADVPGVETVDYPWNVSLNASWPLFQGGANRANIRQTRIEIDKLADQKAQLVQILELNLRAAVLDLTVRWVNLESSQKSAELAEKSLALVQDGYAQGRVSIVNLVDAQNAALASRLSALDSEYEFLVSILKTERAVGKFSMLSTPEEQQNFLKRFEAYFSERAR